MTHDRDALDFLDDIIGAMEGRARVRRRAVLEALQRERADTGT